MGTKAAKKKKKTESEEKERDTVDIFVSTPTSDVFMIRS